MSDENKEPVGDPKKAAEQKAQLSEQELKEVSGGGVQHTDVVVTKQLDKSSPKLHEL